MLILAEPNKQYTVPKQYEKRTTIDLLMSLCRIIHKIFNVVMII